MTHRPHRPRIAFVTDGWQELGGAERLLSTLVTGIDHARFEPLVCTLFGTGDTPHTRAACRAGVHVYHFPMPIRAGPAAAASFARLVAFLRRKRITILHASLDRTIGIIAGRLAGVPVIIQTIHGFQRHESLPARALAGQANHHLIDRSVAVSGFVAGELRRRYHLPPAAVEVISGGVDDRLLRQGKALRPADLGLPTATRLIAVVARLSPEKVPLPFVDAMRRVLDQTPSAAFVLVGDGPSRAPLEQRCRSLGIEARVRFVGRQQQPGPFLRAAAIVAAPSVREGLGLTAIEAMAVGRAVVASNVGGLPEVVVAGETGLLPSPAVWTPSSATLDTRAFADALVSLLNNPARADLMGRRGRARYEDRFSAAVFVERHHRLYDRLCSRGPDNKNGSQGTTGRLYAKRITSHADGPR